MSLINPFTGAVSLPPVRTSAERMRRAQADSKNVPADEAVESAIESPDAVVSIGDEHSHQPPEKDQHHEDKSDDSETEEESPGHLDITA